MEKVAPSRSPMTVYGRPDNALADDEAPARVPPCLFHPFLSVCSPPFLSLSFFFHSSFLPLSFLAPSCLLPFLLLCFVFLSRATHLLQLPWSCAFYSRSHRSPQSEPIYLRRLPLRIREFFRLHVPPPLLLLSPSPFALTYWTDKSTAAHKQVNRTVVRFCLWQGKAISRLFQSSVITWNVSLSGVCFIRLGPWRRPFWETENIISYDLLWYKSELSAVNPIHNYSSVCVCVKGKGSEFSMTWSSLIKIKISCFTQ